MIKILNPRAPSALRPRRHNRPVRTPAAPGWRRPVLEVQTAGDTDQELQDCDSDQVIRDVNVHGRRNWIFAKLDGIQSRSRGVFGFITGGVKVALKREVTRVEGEDVGGLSVDCRWTAVVIQTGALQRKPGVCGMLLKLVG